LFGRYLRGHSIDLDVREIRFDVETEPDPRWTNVGEMKSTIADAVAVAPEATWSVRVVEAPRRTLLVRVPVPPLGTTAIRAVEGAAAVGDPVTASADGMANGLLSVAVRPDGSLRLEAADGTVLDGVGRLVDGGDRGDSYNYAPPATDRLVDTPTELRHRLVESGPLRAAIEVWRTYAWPVGLAPGDAAGSSTRASDGIAIPVLMRAELHAGEPFVRLTLHFENRADDHRLRLHVPLAASTDTSLAEGQFAVVERTGAPEAGHGEVPLPTYPARTFVDAGGAAILCGHVIEYELVDGRELAVTVLRATGLISRDDNAFREDPAGPQVATPDGQCRRAWRFALAVMPHAGQWREAPVLDATERYRAHLVAASGTGLDPEAGLPASRIGLEVAGRGVVLSALRRVGDELELRIVAEHPDADEAIVRGTFETAREVDLLGEPVGAPLDVRDGALRLPIRPWEIRTLRLR
jgi:alpha-mannosidase